MSLTKHPPGSLRELWALSFPLMLSSLSVMFMIFADRWLLAHYSVGAHNAAVAATTLGWAFIFGWIVLANIAEVFVAQYNGAGLLHKMGEPVWQMIWASLFSSVFFIPMAIWGPELFYGSGLDAEMERTYLRVMLLFGPFYPLSAALSAFFIGQGKTRLVTILIVIANIVNVILDQMLIFGIDGWIPSLGVTGAAIATSVSMILQVVVLAWVFFSPKHCKKHGTLQWRINWKNMGECVRVGLPSALFFMCEILAFAVYYALMKNMGEGYITVAGICQTMLLLFSFFTEGVNKATATIVGNLIGAKRAFLIPNVIWSGLKLNALFFGGLLASFSLGSPWIIQEFLSNATPEFIEQIRYSLEICLILTAAYVFFEGVRMQFAGVLTAAGDTLFLSISGLFLVWGLMVLPVYLIVNVGKGSVEHASCICSIYAATSAIVYGARIWQGKWRSMAITSDVISIPQSH